MLQEFLHNFEHNLFKPLLLFFYFGFLLPLLKVDFEFPYVIYQGLTMYLLVAIGWHGGEELAEINASSIAQIAGFMVVGFLLNIVIGLVAYLLLSRMTALRRVDKATVAGYYGSDSAGTFATCVAILVSIGLAFDAYMPVMLAVMEVPGCLVALYLVARLRHRGMDVDGNMPDEPGYVAAARANYGPGAATQPPPGQQLDIENERGIAQKLDFSLDRHERDDVEETAKKAALLSRQLLREVFLNPGLLLLFGGIAIGFISGLQGHKVTHDDDVFFVSAFQGALCLFLLEMGMTAARKLRDLRSAGRGFIFFGLLAPNLFAPHPHRVQAGDVCVVRGALRRGVLYRGAGGAATGDPRGEPDVAVGRVAGFDVLLQRHHRNPVVHRDRPRRRTVVPDHLTLKEELAQPVT
jgi:uncharacterized protein